MSFTDPHLKSKATSVPGKGVMQNHVYEPQAQDDAGFGSLGKGGIADAVPGKTVREDECLKQGQDAGSIQARVPGGGNLNKGASGEGMSAIDGTSPELRSTKAALHARHGNSDIGVNPGQLFPGIHD